VSLKRLRFPSNKLYVGDEQIGSLMEWNPLKRVQRCQLGGPWNDYDHFLPWNDCDQFLLDFLNPGVGCMADFSNLSESLSAEGSAKAELLVKQVVQNAILIHDDCYLYPIHPHVQILYLRIGKHVLCGHPLHPNVQMLSCAKIDIYLPPVQWALACPA
jgi:hypothetical protein